ncbi:hypothetical protein HF086_009040 [Spodoptera exigua]|uniref:Uncharacterized protein n=1 Tax=Spodoptera exigua TaxID=7107 RepID=A0A922SDH1_SPOEX|nr:hypothetical protein HF086_009040 [Spodoptera exigua]
MTRDLKCDDFFPWFAMTTQGDMVGTGFQMVGKMTKPKKARNWFDDITNPKQGLSYANCVPILFNENYATDFE